MRLFRDRPELSDIVPKSSRNSPHHRHQKYNKNICTTCKVLFVSLRFSLQLSRNCGGIGPILSRDRSGIVPGLFPMTHMGNKTSTTWRRSFVFVRFHYNLLHSVIFGSSRVSGCRDFPDRFGTSGPAFSESRKSRDFKNV